MAKALQALSNRAAQEFIAVPESASRHERDTAYNRLCNAMAGFAAAVQRWVRTEPGGGSRLLWADLVAPGLQVMRTVLAGVLPGALAAG
mmetsp:Transcript_20775/g.52786  ORF Transcript_20775/g.52786 Transcript_20775/m.52786 type:complete len:89 (-) Transcript_20775:2701-2967(-)